MKLRQLRRSAGESQEDTARKTGIAQNTISLIERGEREARVSTLRTLAEHFGVSVAELLGEEDSPKGEGGSVVVRSLLDGADAPGHDYLTRSPQETAEDADEMSVPAILVRLQDLSAERSYLRSLRPSEFPNPREVKAEIRLVRRNFVPNVMELVSAAERKVEAAGLTDEATEEAIASIERGAAEALQEANAAV